MYFDRFTDADKNKFWNYINNQNISQCWTWNGLRDKKGQGIFRYYHKGKIFSIRATRILYEYFINSELGKKQIFSNCDMSICCNPHHYGELSLRYKNSFDNPKFLDRFWSNVETGTTDECWNWSGYKNGDGYGYLQIKYKGVFKCIFAHRLSYMLTYGYDFDKNPESRCLHKCDNPKCINPGHLFIGTQIENIQDMWNKGREHILKGSESSNSKLDECQVNEIKKLLAVGKTSLDTIAQRYSVTRQNIRSIQRGITWKDVVI